MEKRFKRHCLDHTNLLCTIVHVRYRGIKKECLIFSFAETGITCPKHWKNYGISCYKTFTMDSEIKWIDANTICQKDGGNLVSILTAEEGMFLQSTLLDSIGRNSSDLKFYIGM